MLERTKSSLARPPGPARKEAAISRIPTPAITEFLADKWQREREYRLIKQLWAFHDNRIAVRFAYEWHDADGRWFRSYGNENWEFDASGLMRARLASINDLALLPGSRLFHWPLGRRPDGHPSLSDLGL